MKYLLKMLAAVFHAAPGHAVFGVLATLIAAAEKVTVAAFLPKFLYDALTGGTPWEQIVTTVLSIGVLMLLSYGSLFLQEEWSAHALEAQLFERMQKPIFDKSLRVDMQQYDDADFYDSYRWASTEADKRAMQIYKAFLELLSCLANLGGFLGLILSMDPVVALIAAAYYIASFLLNRRIARINLEKSEQLNQPRRCQEYVERIFSSPEYAKDLRMTNIAKPLLARLRDNTNTILELHRQYGRQAVHVKNWLSACDALFVDVSIYAYLAYALLIRGNITVGAFVSLAAAAENILWKVQRIVNIVTSCAEHAMYAKKYYDFLEAVPKMPDGQRTPVSAAALELQNVRFAYPGTEKPILSDFSMTIRPGEHVAIVGRNGAGKSTLVKLLLRLYDPDAGTVSCGGVDARDCAQFAWRQQFGVLFQDFHIFAATLAQNVAMDAQYDAVRVEAALREAGLEVTPEVFPQGLDTMISRQFDEHGTQLSGGQMQKVAIARALYADPAVLILDEPSSALDPIAEYEFNRTFLAHLAGRTLIIIAHRLSTVRMMDRIVLIDGERIAEEGSHEQLMEQGGLYAQMFDAQRRQYEIEGVLE